MIWVFMCNSWFHVMYKCLMLNPKTSSQHVVCCVKFVETTDSRSTEAIFTDRNTVTWSNTHCIHCSDVSTELIEQSYNVWGTDRIWSPGKPWTLEIGCSRLVESMSGGSHQYHLAPLFLDTFVTIASWKQIREVLKFPKWYFFAIFWWNSLELFCDRLKGGLQQYSCHSICWYFPWSYTQASLPSWAEVTQHNILTTQLQGGYSSVIYLVYFFV